MSARTVADIRADLGVVRCPTCAQDTIPDEVSGCCFFCDTNLVPPQPDADTGARRAYCAHCGARFDPENTVREYCTERCKNTAWYHSDSGREWLDRTREKRNEARKLRRQRQRARERAA